MSKFVELHVHTMYSTLDGAPRLEDLIKRAKELNMKAVAISDHGTVFGIYDFYKQCKAAGIKPIIGCEFYFREDGEIYHLLVLAKSYDGVKMIYKLQEYAHTDGYESKPCIDRRAINRWNKDLIFTSACIGGPIGKNIIKTDQRKVEDLINFFSSFPFYLEIQDNAIPEQMHVNKEIIKLSKRFNLPLVLTADTHYTEKDDAFAHEVLLAMQTGKKMTDEKRFKFSCNDFWFKSEDEIKQGLTYLDPLDVEEAILNTSRIADMCNVEFPGTENHLPKFVCPPGYESKNYLSDLLANRIDKRGLNDNKEYIDRLNYEFEIICNKGYEDYFLIVWDFVRFAKENNILVGPGRGSAAGSLIAYLLGITNVDPIKYGLLFERFLNPDRMSHPDIDIDFDYNRRYEVINYIIQKYEWNRVAQIITFGKMTANAVTRRVFSAFDFKENEIKRITSLIPDNLGVTIADAMKIQEFHKYMIRYPDQYKVIQRLENVISHTSRHAAGVVITPGPLSNYIPVYKLKSEDTLITQFHKKQIEDLGVYKFDILALKTLTIIADALKMIKDNEGIEIDIDNLEYDNPEVYEFLRSGNLDGIFQFDGDSGKRAVKAVQPTCFDDIIACEAICRPGVKEADLYVLNKQRKDFKRVHSIVDNVLQETSGAIVYQEQVMLLVHKMAGWTLGKADSLRKVKDLNDFRDQFINDCTARSISAGVASSVWDRFDLGYSFNKSHACAYAVISYITALLKAKYYKYFVVAQMNMNFDDQTKVASYAADLQKRGIEIVPPDINKSERLYTIKGNKVYFALQSIKDVGDKALTVLMEKRPFTSLSDLMNRVPKRQVNAKVVKALIKTGCFDFEKDRNELLKETFNESIDDILQIEKEYLGTFISSHPMDKYFFKPWDEYPQKIPTALVGGIIDEVKPVTDKNGKRMAFVKLDTKEGIREGVVFASTYVKYMHLLSKGKVVMLKGTKDNQSILVNTITELV